LNSELTTLEPVILSPTSTELYEVWISNKDNSWSPIRTMLKQVGSEYYLIAVNMDNTTINEVDFRFTPDIFGANVMFEGTQEGPPDAITGGTITDKFTPFAVHVYRFWFEDDDYDEDGVDNVADNCWQVSNSGQADADMDGAGTACDPNDAVADIDQDRCTDGEELGLKQGKGGRRNPDHFWDFMDQYTGSPLARDKIVAVGDIGAVVNRFGSSGDPNGDPLTPPAAATGYHTSADRNGSVPGQDPWDLNPPNGSISIGDYGAVVAQYGHSCLDPP
jgi:hypothetical protein